MWYALSGCIGRRPRPRRLVTWLAVAAFLAAPVPAPASAQAQTTTRPDFVCARLVLALDGSASTAASAFSRQVRALDVAFREPALAAAVQDCLPGTVAVAVIVWAGPSDQRLCQPWTAIDGRAALHALADRLHQCPYPGGTTDIGAALERALDLIAGAPFESHYRIVFLGTNGLTNIGADRRLADAQARAVAEGVTVNGHALLQPASIWKARTTGPDPFQTYVEQQVTAGPRAFTVASDRDTDAAVVLDALIRMLRQELH